MLAGKTALDYLALMQRRNYPFRLIQSALKDNDLPSAQGWEPLVDKYKLSTNAKAPAFISTLAAINRDLMLHAQKAVALFPVSAIRAKRFRRIIASTNANPAFNSLYPFTLHGPSLASLNIKLAPAAIEREGNENQLLFGRKIFETDRERFDVADLSTVPTSLSGFDQVIAIRRTARQLFHIVRIREANDQSFVEIRLDTLGQLLAEDYKKEFGAIKRWLNRRYLDAYGRDKAVKKELNLFPAISKLYDAPDGKIRHLGATTDSASIKQERMRSRQDDLRQEPFHKNGKAAMKLNGFNVEKTWESILGSTTPSIVVPGRVSDASSQQPHVPMALVHGAASIDDYELVLGKLFTALSP